MRRNVLARHGQTPLFVLAGFPHPISGAVAKSVQNNCSPTPRVIFEPAPRRDGEPLYKPETLAALIRAVSEYAVRQRKADYVPPAPAHILLAYVPASDDEVLLAQFDFFVFPVRLTLLGDYDERGRQHRHNLSRATDYTLASIETALREFKELQRRLSSISDKDPLFLPPQNFRVSQTQRIADTFKAMVHQKISWADPLNDLQRMRVTNEDLPMHVRPGAHKHVLADSRGLLFPGDRRMHGPERELAEGAPAQDRRDFLRSVFRFGVRLQNGCHHDVQHAGRSLGGETFECCTEGLRVLNCGCANVYPNDFVRPSNT